MATAARPKFAHPTVDAHDPQTAAAKAGLNYTSDTEPGINRRRHGAHFRYIGADGAAVRDAGTLARIRHLAIPPAYTDVWISADPDGHIQATGRDAKGRKQYRYHEAFRAIRDTGKYQHLARFAAALPRIRAQVDTDLARRGLPREKVLATVIRLMEATMIRIGNESYARANQSFGLTTLHNRHVDVAGAELRFHFKGKSGKQWRLALHDRRVARIVRGIQELPGQHLFQYLDDDGARHAINSRDINAYLRAAADDEITAKDFRTWHGTVLAVAALSGLESFASEAQAKRNIRDAIVQVAQRLGNTPTVCRKCYVHPVVVEHYLADALFKPHGAAAIVAATSTGDLSIIEAMVARLVAG